MPMPREATLSAVKALLITAGSHGDIHPFIAIGRALRARGHEAVVSTNPYFQAQIEAAELGFSALGEREELKQIIADNKVMDPMWGPMVVMRKLVLPWVGRFVSRTREMIRELRPDVVVYHPIVMGVPWACELEGGVRTAAVSPSPLLWSNPADQCVLLPGRSHTPRPSAVKFDMFIGRMFLRLLMDPGLNRVRRELGLPARRDNFHLDAVGGHVNLGVWSPVLRGAMKGDPTNAVITGYCWHDRDHTQEVAEAELKAFMETGPAPIVFALGSTGVHASGKFYEHAVEAAARLKQRALLVVGRDQPPPKNLPRDGSMKAVAYAPYSAVFAKASVVVHHGGAGTTAQGLRAGRPTLITPMAHDQFDNAARVKRLGAGLTLRFAKVNAVRMEHELRRVLSEGTYARAAAGLGERVRGEDGARVAAERLEGLVEKGAAEVVGGRLLDEPGMK
jgi:rhamnosyltransferase subunit B